MPPAKECHHELVLIGRFSTLTAISAAPPNPRDHYGIELGNSIRIIGKIMFTLTRTINCAPP